MLRCKNSMYFWTASCYLWKHWFSNLYPSDGNSSSSNQDEKEASNGMTDRYDFIGRPFDRQAVDSRSQMWFGIMKQAAAYLLSWSIHLVLLCLFLFFVPFLTKTSGKLMQTWHHWRRITCIDNVAIDVASKNETDDDSKLEIKSQRSTISSMIPLSSNITLRNKPVVCLIRP